MLNTAGLSDEQRYELYIQRAIAAAGSRYCVARVFGSNRHRGETSADACRRYSPYDKQDDPFPSDVNPHEHRDGVIVTIAEHLVARAAGDEHGVR